MKRIGGMFTGMMVGAAAVTLYGMMNARSQRRLGRMAASASRRVADITGELFGR